jgi:pyruvate ferredoxin oxidoreductase delta subunit
MGQLFAVELIYRGVFQKTLAKNICRGIVLAAHNEGKPGISFGRYGDSPERNGIPAKSFAIVATDDQTLEEGMAQYEPKQVDATVILDDTLCKGIESWAWYGVHPVNRTIKPSAPLIVISTEEPNALVSHIHRRSQPYKLGVLKGTASFSGMWNFKDDHTDVRVLGAIAKVLPKLVSIDSVQKFIVEKLKNTTKVTSARNAFDRFTTINVAPNTGNAEELITHAPLKWQDMRDGVSVAGQPQGGPFPDPVTNQVGGFRPVRNLKLRKGTSRTMRPVVNFETCTKCTLCWLNCPDASFDVTADGFYDANMEVCCGCGVCEAVCPVNNCVTMVNESAFKDGTSQHAAFTKDHNAYKVWLTTVAKPDQNRSHGFRYRGQYKEQVPAAIAIAEKG